MQTSPQSIHAKCVSKYVCALFCVHVISSCLLRPCVHVDNYSHRFQALQTGNVAQKKLPLLNGTFLSGMPRYGDMATPLPRAVSSREWTDYVSQISSSSTVPMKRLHGLWLDSAMMPSTRPPRMPHTGGIHAVGAWCVSRRGHRQTGLDRMHEVRERRALR
jgi:hypothetical protein